MTDFFLNLLTGRFFMQFRVMHACCSNHYFGCMLYNCKKSAICFLYLVYSWKLYMFSEMSFTFNAVDLYERWSIIKKNLKLQLLPNNFVAQNTTFTNINWKLCRWWGHLLIGQKIRKNTTITSVKWDVWAVVFQSTTACYLRPSGGASVMLCFLTFVISWQTACTKNISKNLAEVCSTCDA